MPGQGNVIWPGELKTTVDLGITYDTCHNQLSPLCRPVSPNLKDRQLGGVNSEERIKSFRCIIKTVDNLKISTSQTVFNLLSFVVLFQRFFNGDGKFSFAWIPKLAGQNFPNYHGITSQHMSAQNSIKVLINLLLARAPMWVLFAKWKFSPLHQPKSSHKHFKELWNQIWLIQTRSPCGFQAC
jgi:hypothetical protein